MNLIQAAEFGNAAEVARLLARGAAPNAADEYGRTPLRQAVLRGHVHVMRLLLKAGASPAVPVGLGLLLPHLACENGNDDAVRLLVESAPATATLRDSKRKLPLHHAVITCSAATVSLLLSAAPAAATAQDSSGKLPLHHAAASGTDAVVRLLVEAAPAAAAAPDRDGRVPLHCAAVAGNAAAARVLVEAAPESALARRPDVTADAAALFDALFAAARQQRSPRFRRHLDTARAILPATPARLALDALARCCPRASPLRTLFAAVAQQGALTPEEWRLFPSRCAALAAALPAVLERSEAEAALLVALLPWPVRERLHVAALALHRAQRQAGVELPAALAGHIMALTLA